MESRLTLKSFAVQGAVSAVAAIVLTCVVLGIFSFADITQYHNKMYEIKLVSTSVSVAEIMNGDFLENLKAGDETTPEYQEMLRKCSDIANKLELEYLYILTRIPGTAQGQYMFLLDTDTEAQAPIEDVYDVDEIPALEAALNGKSGLSDIYEDDWGRFRTGYAPIYDSAGKVAGVICADCDMNALQDDVYQKLVAYITRCFIILALIISAVMIITVMCYGRIKSRLLYVITQLRDFTKNISGSVSVFNGESELLSNRANESVDAISEISETLRKISDEIKLTDNNIRKSANHFSKVTDGLSNGTAKISELSESINDIKKSGDEISGVIEIINSIAKKTKILALNAEVEAARIGNEGRSFSVVAQEVETLAESIENASKGTGELINQNKVYIQKSISNIGGVKDVIFTVEKEIDDLSEIISGISETSTNQTRHIDEIRKDVSTVENAAAENAGSAQGISSSANELSVATETLQVHVDGISDTISRRLTI